MHAPNESKVVWPVRNFGGAWLARMSRLIGAAAGLAILAMTPKESAAFDCTKAYLAVDYVICSDPSLIERVDRLQETWNTLRRSLDDERRKALTAEQKQWINDYSARCGVPGRGVPTMGAVVNAFTCVGESLTARTAYLAGLAPAGRTAPALQPPPRPSKDAAKPGKTPDWTANPEPVVVHIDDAHMTIVGEPPWMPGFFGGTWDIHLLGPIDAEATARFVAFLDQHGVPDGSSVSLHSPGGSLGAGLALGREFRKRSFSTSINGYPEVKGGITPGRCYSACAIAFLGGKFRDVPAGSEYGVHRFAFRQSTGRDADAAQVLSALVVTYLGDMGIDQRLFALMSSAGSDEIKILSKPDLEQMRIVHFGDEYPTWTIEAHDFGVYLKGQQETWRGISKTMFFCAEAHLAITAMFSGNEESFMLARGNPPQTLTIDKVPITVNGFQRAKLERSGNYITGSYILPRNVVAMIAKANTIGYAIQPPNPAIFYGFEMKILPDARKKFVGMAAACGP